MSYPQKKEKEGAEAPVPPRDSDYHRHAQDDFPDGGLRAWLVVFGVRADDIARRFGYVNSWGVFQDHYQNVLLKGTSPSTIAWIGSMQYALVFFPALISGRLFDIGYLRGPLILASINLVLCTFLIAECQKYWQFLLCQGFGVGISCGLIFGPVMSVVAHWFKKRRSTAMGVVAFASSIGGTVLPIAFRNLNATVGFKWSMRIIAFALMSSLGITTLTLERRLPPVVASGGLFNLKQFRSPAYSVYTVAGFVAFLGLYTVLTFIDESAPSQDVPEHLSFYLVSIANAGSAVGRLTSGILADRVGAINVMVPATFLAGVLTILWPHLRGTGALVTLALLYGASSGAFVGLIGVPMMALGDSTDIGRRTGMYFTILSFGALAGPPISGAINHATAGYTAVGIYAGVSVVIAVVLLVITRYFALGGWRGKV
ncbi:MFS general substrate transporter [Multifurca ochricompacta]|uniref:MFS general substrate transporter n=1 Tax=Multifurca ochricompacta TaxID=376703 RepID=A0AAD4QRG1_9AGAM|nr:MFS general substrate transporter [Multifurca ochricompacta]